MRETVTKFPLLRRPPRYARLVLNVPTETRDALRLQTQPAILPTVDIMLSLQMVLSHPANTRLDAFAPAFEKLVANATSVDLLRSIFDSSRCAAHTPLMLHQRI